MSTPGPSSGGNPFEGLFGELAKLFANQGPVNLDVARQMSRWLAVEGQPEANVDPLERIRYEELVRVAEMHVGTATGLDTAVTGGLLTARPVGRGEWASRTLEAYRHLFEGLASALAPPTGDDDVADDPEADPTAMLMGGVSQVVGPLLLGVQAGSMVGYLAQRALGQYDLPIPRPPSDDLVVVPVNVNAFAQDWSLPLDDVRLWICLSEIGHHAVLGRPHVGRRLDELLRGHVGGFRADPAALEEKLGAVDPTDPASFQAVLGDPTELLGAIQTPEQQTVRQQLAALVAAVEGYVDHVLDTVGRKLIGSYGPLTEALRRRRVEGTDGSRFVERLFGLELGRAQFERGAAFVSGVVDRAGEDGLSRLWRSERELPTPAEVDAPGLWLARIDIGD
ncbi:MAG TPA: zinc-dependent metalloprotease [Acidimicrobiales bacterium]|nr:zinc-dependent metalloprotease [Acidimicrobiales bacterium]